MNGIDEPRQAGNEAVVIDSDLAPPVPAGFLGCGHFDGDQAGAAVHARQVISNAIVGDEALVVRRARGHRRHDDTVLDFDRTDPRRSEKSIHSAPYN
ncbi:MAG TPA: hypothetical protein VGV62_08340 [Xanthobacteraceae bacterium]|nr:hypothetical protein [Xanthobacteraceae bacterium]